MYVHTFWEELIPFLCISATNPIQVFFNFVSCSQGKIQHEHEQTFFCCIRAVILPELVLNHWPILACKK